ncbi:uncharacterized protein LOC114534786 [Dendronephthya gigantea]|uniref:uncharacterized protein LOC114534786 n=1 Tax=Dendronephthya gigantea TaxID=151771 RepID=UPI00106D9D5B|nr:uncharacterized protein LOC114534786 [Dendronephthya gigantea]
MDDAGRKSSYEAQGSSDDEFNASFQQINFEEDTHDTVEYDSPSSSFSNLEELGFGKHTLTPESKASNEPKSKRFAASNLSSRQCSQRRNQLASKLEEILEYRENPDDHVEQSVLMEYLDVMDDQKSILTRAIKALFPEATKRSAMIANNQP